MVRAGVALATILATAITTSGAAVELYEIRADPPRVGPYRVHDDPTMRGIIGSFGPPTSCRVTSRGSSIATWNRFGLRVSFVTFGGVPRGRTSCTYRGMPINWIRASGRRRWRTGVGLRPADSIIDVRRRYPGARYDARPGQPWPTPAYWLVHSRERCVVGECPSRYHRVPKLIAVIRHQYVQSFFLPVGAQGD
jgi:hypothetical protein